MRRSILSVLLVFVSLAVACQVPQYAPVDPKGDFTGRVVAVGDGDSITVLDDSKQERRVRFFAIDSPELNQAFGKQSKQHLSDLIFGKTVKVEVHGRDRYQRSVGKVLLDGLDINLEQVKGGFAWHYRAFENQQDWPDRVAYRDAETAARESKLGLWTESDPEPPWQHRKDERER
ncbi:MAG: thermonuclease family protein [Acidobacteria bacterium]|nr:thermonuclease family protein [Acidobacteriota bacterium]MBK8810343.1 thermonuclease family protein [Acidobacteriota bacterium]